jgi:hypothetical protein
MSEKKQAILNIISAWLDSASEPKSTDRELVIRKSSLLTDDAGRHVGVRFIIEAKTAVGMADLPIEAPSIITPTTDDVKKVTQS